MGIRGRQSGASMGVVAVLEVRRPRPPAGLTEAEGGIWRDTVDTSPSGWFTKANFPVLIQYCRHTARASLLAAELERWKPEWLTDPDGPERLDRLLKMAERETRAITACARAMRLTPQARIDAKKAGTEFRGAGVRGPWEANEEE